MFERIGAGGAVSNPDVSAKGKDSETDQSKVRRCHCGIIKVHKIRSKSFQYTIEKARRYYSWRR